MSLPEERLAPGPQPESAVVEPSLEVGRVLSAEQRAVLSAVLDRLIPPSPTGLPAAGELGVVDYFERTLASSLPLRRTFLEGIVAIELAGFLDLEPDARDAALRRVERERPAFFAALVNHAYRGYYTHPRALADLTTRVGYEARPPQPLGHAMEPFDPALLEKQRAREPFWRRTAR